MNNKDLPIGTIRHTKRHGNSTWIVEEDKFTNVAVIYPGERMPWMMSRSGCSFCGKLSTDRENYGRVYSRLCNCLECKKENRKDGKNVYWRLLSLGKPSKQTRNFTQEESIKYQTVSKESVKFMDFDCPVFDGNMCSAEERMRASGGTLREATSEEKEYIEKNRT